MGDHEMVRTLLIALALSGCANMRVPDSASAGLESLDEHICVAQGRRFCYDGFWVRLKWIVQ